MPGIHMKLTREHREVGTGMENVNEPEMVNNEFDFFYVPFKACKREWVKIKEWSLKKNSQDLTFLFQMLND